MQTLIHADIFFFLTSIAVVLGTIVLAVCGVLVIRVLWDVKNITRRVRREAELFSEDIAEARYSIKREGLRWQHLSKFFGKRSTRRGRANQ